MYMYLFSHEAGGNLDSQALSDAQTKVARVVDLLFTSSVLASP